MSPDRRGPKILASFALMYLSKYLIIIYLSILENPEGEYICIATNNIGASEERIIIEGNIIYPLAVHFWIFFVLVTSLKICVL